MGYNVILVSSGSTPILTKYDVIMQRSKNIHDIRVYVQKNYFDFNMEEFIATMEFVTPDGEYHTVSLEPSETPLKEGYVQYDFALEAKNTRFAGNLDIAFTFTYVDPDNAKAFVRKTNTVTIPITPVQKWQDLISDDALGVLDKKLVEMKAMMNEISADAEVYNTTKADGVTISSDGILKLTSGGTELEPGVNVAIPSVEDDFDGNNDGIIDANSIDFDIIEI